MSSVMENSSGMTLQIERYAGVLGQGDAQELIGGAITFKQLPSRQVRRLSAMEKGVIACLMGLGDDIKNTPIVFASRYGAMLHTLSLLKAIVEDETLSPTQFSLSVHNAAVGVASQLTQNRGGHTAVAAGDATLFAALIEAEALLESGNTQVIVLFSDHVLPGEYEEHAEDKNDIQFSLLLKREQSNAGRVTLSGDHNDPTKVLDALSNGVEAICWRR